MSQNGKGSKPRPLSVSYEKFGDNWDMIFKKKQPEDKSIEIGKDGLCTCSCADPCPFGKVGSSLRCSEKELNDAGFKTKRIT